MARVKLAAREFENKYGAKCEDDVYDLAKRLKLLQSEVKSFKGDLPIDQFKLKRVSNLITVYETIVDENYIAQQCAVDTFIAFLYLVCII